MLIRPFDEHHHNCGLNGFLWTLLIVIFYFCIYLIVFIICTKDNDITFRLIEMINLKNAAILSMTITSSTFIEFLFVGKMNEEISYKKPFYIISNLIFGVNFLFSSLTVYWFDFNGKWLYQEQYLDLSCLAISVLTIIYSLIVRTQLFISKS